MSAHHTETLAGIITLAGVTSSTISLIVLHMLPTGLSPLRNPVSQYGITTFRLGYRIQTLAMGVAAIAAAIGIARIDIQSSALVVALLAVFGIARLLISWSPMDLPGGESTSSGRRLGLLAITAFVSATAAALRLGSIVNRADVWRGASAPITTSGVIMIASLLMMGAARRESSIRRYFGLIERGFYLGAIAFLVVIGLELIGP